jgi:S1-C subfamily serine protease
MITHEPPVDVSPAETPPPRPRPGRLAGTLVVVAALVAGAGYVGDHLRQTSRPAPSGTAVPESPNRSTALDPVANAGGSTTADAITRSLAPSVVNLTTSLSSGGSAAGTGIVISSSGLVLTNNHVIADSTSIRAESAATGATYRGTVLGYDPSHDVAVVQLQSASGLAAAPIGSAARVTVGDSVIALGNAAGLGGTPAVAPGSVTALDQPITASDPSGGNAESLTHLIQIDAPIQPGDSGGPLADAQGRVIGMNTAASATRGGFGFRTEAATEGYAIPIQDALTIAHAITSGRGGSSIHLGATRGVLGVEVSAESDRGATAATVVGVEPGSGAEAASITEGDVITAVDGTTVSSAADLTLALVRASPRDVVRVSWTDSSGTSHHASVTLGSAPPN